MKRMKTCKISLTPTTKKPKICHALAITSAFNLKLCLKKNGMVLLSALVERFSVSRMLDFSCPILAFHIILYCVVLFCVVLCCIVLCCVMLFSVVLYCLLRTTIHCPSGSWVPVLPVLPQRSSSFIFLF